MLPYLDLTTFTEAPTGLDLSQIVPAGSAAAQSAAIQNVLERASSAIDSFCYQRLAATTDSEQKRVRPNLYGQLEIFTRNFPVISVLSAQYNDFSSPTATWTAIDVTKVQPLERSLLVYDQDYSWWRGLGTNPLVVQYQYENGYPLTTLTANAAAAATTVTVGSTVGVGTTGGGSAGWNLVSELEILDGSTREIVEVAAINGNVLTLASPLANAHTAGALVSGCPKVVEEAAILICTWMVKNPRGDASFVMSGGGVETQRTPQTTGDSLLDAARGLLQPFRRTL